MTITLIAAQSLDGRITRHGEAGDSWTSPADKIHFRAEVRRCDGWIMGAESYRNSREHLPVPLSPALRRVVLTRNPAAFVDEGVSGALEFSDEVPAVLVARLRGLGLKRCALLGGAQIYTQFLAAGLVDEVAITIEPRFFGQGKPLLGAAMDVRLTLLAVERLPGCDAFCVRYQVQR